MEERRRLRIAFITSVVMFIACCVAAVWYLNNWIPSGARSIPSKPVTADSTPADQAESRHCAFVVNQRETVVGQRSAVSLSIDQCLSEIINRARANDDITRVLDILTSSHPYVDAELMPISDGIIITESSRNKIQPFVPGPSWLWFVTPTRAGKHEMVIEIRSLTSDDRPALFTSAPIPVTTEATERPASTPAAPTTLASDVLNTPEKQSVDDSGSWTTYGIVALAVGILALVLAFTGPVLPFVQKWRCKRTDKPQTEPDAATGESEDRLDNDTTK